MKLENKFYSTFFYPFLIGVVLSIIIVAIILSYYSNNYLDKKSAEDIYTIEKEYAKINLKSINLLIYNVLLKVQVGLHEQLKFYNNTANTILNITDFSKFSISKNIFNVLNISKNNNNNIDYGTIWFVDNKIFELKDKSSILFRQVYIVSQLTQSLYSVYFSMKDVLMNIYFLFEETNLFIAYPYIYFEKAGLIESFGNFHNNPTWCTDEKGDVKEYYTFKCRDFFHNIMKSKENLFDTNLKDQPERKIYITYPYTQFGEQDAQVVFTLCIEFTDIISNKTVYLCGDINGTNLFDSFDNFNEKFIGYFSITSVGFNSPIYFPQMSSYGYGKTLGEYIFRWDKDYYLEEKLDFANIVQKKMTSNYYYKINWTIIEKDPISVFDEIIIDDSNGENQYFYLDGEKFDYSIFPIILLDYKYNYEHVLSIVYLFNKKLFYKNMLDYQSEAASKLFLQLILFIFFGSVLLYLIVLSFGLLAKFIVIPIKNVQYMLEGINIGGEYRLEYLNDLKKKQEENLDRLNKINQQLFQRNSEKNKYIKQINVTGNAKVSEGKGKEKEKNNDARNKEKENEEKISEKKTMKNASIGRKSIIDEEKLLNNSMDSNEENTDIHIEYNGEIINPKINHDKEYDLQNDKIEKEINFYDFDEELLQYRPVEIDRLVQSLLKLKSALKITSTDQEVEHIIDYSNSEYIFNDFKNEEGSRMCQSNIGNLQSQLLKYDKAIYHLALSLQNVDLKKFLSLTLSDEIDESDSLLHKIELNYNTNTKEKEMNELARKQQNNKHKNFSQKIIGTLINFRYNKLIHIYFKFFSFIQKSNYNYEELSGCFMHTEFHTINYYHKILIQYVYLCFVSNDLVKIGESILDYIEFLLKFKLKTSKDNKSILYFYNKDYPEIREKQLYKKNILIKL